MKRSSRRSSRRGGRGRGARKARRNRSRQTLRRGEMGYLDLLGIAISDPMYVKADMDSNAASSGDDEGGPASTALRKKKRYRLRPRTLFNSGVALKPFKGLTLTDDEEEDDDEEVDSEASAAPRKGGKRKKKKKNKDEDYNSDMDVFFQFPSEEEEEDSEIDFDDIVDELGLGNRKSEKRSSYSGVRGPKADAKALNIVSNCPICVKWLVDNFEYCPGRSLPRGFVYEQYVLLCHINALEPVNAASFGKLIRSVFPGLKTRRLGTRGNSKYHYNGVYLKAASSLMVILNNIKTRQKLSYEGNGKRGRRVKRSFEDMAVMTNGVGNKGALVMNMAEGEEIMDSMRKEYLDAKLLEETLDVPFGLIRLDGSALRDVDSDTLKTFETIYHAHCSLILQYFGAFDLKAVLNEMKRFWRLKCPMPGAERERDFVFDYKKRMDKATLCKVCSLTPVITYIKMMDLSTFQLVIDLLYPCITRGMPIGMVNELRLFMQSVENLAAKFLDCYPKMMAGMKLRCIRALVDMWSDQSSVNRMLRAATCTLKNDENIQAMKKELNRSIDFAELDERIKSFQFKTAAWLQDVLIMQFRDNLASFGGCQSESIQTWHEWAEGTAAQLLEESARQVSSGEVSGAISPCLWWNKASDRILGAVIKGNTASFVAFKGFLLWLDTLMKLLTKLHTAKYEGYAIPCFYYEKIVKGRVEVEETNEEPPGYMPYHWKDSGPYSPPFSPPDSSDPMSYFISFPFLHSKPGEEEDDDSDQEQNPTSPIPQEPEVEETEEREQTEEQQQQNPSSPPLAPQEPDEETEEREQSSEQQQTLNDEADEEEEADSILP